MHNSRSCKALGYFWSEFFGHRIKQIQKRDSVNLCKSNIAIKEYKQALDAELRTRRIHIQHRWNERTRNTTLSFLSMNGMTNAPQTFLLIFSLHKLLLQLLPFNHNYC